MKKKIAYQLLEKMNRGGHEAETARAIIISEGHNLHEFVAKYSEDQERDEHGRFSSGSGNGPGEEREPVTHGSPFRDISMPVLPTGEKLNPAKHTGFYANTGGSQSTLIVSAGKTPNGKEKLRAVTTAGSANGFKVGDTLHSTHDQNPGKRMFGYDGAKIIGITDTTTNEKWGNVPDKNLPHYVFK